MILLGIRKTASLKNLLTASCSGQIATLLTLSMVIVLIVIVATIKVGNVSNKATAISNAADSSALLLASQLSTKAYQLWDSLDGDPGDGKGTTEKVHKEQFFEFALGGDICDNRCSGNDYTCSFYRWWFSGCASSNIKDGNIYCHSRNCRSRWGAVGAMASGTNVLQGATQGAAIGAAIGGIACGTIGMMNPAFFSTTTIVPMVAGMALSGGNFSRFSYYCNYYCFNGSCCWRYRHRSYGFGQRSL